MLRGSAEEGPSGTGDSPLAPAPADAPRSRPARGALLLAGVSLGGALLWCVLSGICLPAPGSGTHHLAFAGWSAVTAGALAATSYVLLRGAEREGVRRARRVELAEVAARGSPCVLATSYAHDFNNVLTAVSGNCQLVAADPTLPARARARLEQALGAIERGSEIARRLGRSARAATRAGTGRTDLAEAAAAAIDLLGSHPRVRGCRVALRVEGRPIADADPVAVSEILNNLVLNAADASPGGNVEVRVSGSGGRAALEVHDDGGGISEAVRARLFEPFFTTKAHGTGIGLVSVLRCAQSNRGRVDVLDSPLGGACFRVELPLAEAGPVAA